MGGGVWGPSPKERGVWGVSPHLNHSQSNNVIGGKLQQIIMTGVVILEV